MGKSEEKECVIWRGGFEDATESINDQESSYPDLDDQEGDADDGDRGSLLGLTLRKTPSFLSLLQSRLFNGAPDNPSLSMPEKLKASNFPATHLRIGGWQRTSRHEGDLTAKLYYAKRKLVWEVLDGALKSKIEIQWSDIIAIRAVIIDKEPGKLVIELNKPPVFYQETNPQPRKHTIWQQASDFTGGQAAIWRRHCVVFPPGILDRHYEKLLQVDQRLLNLSQRPFPINVSPYFDSAMFGLSGNSLSFNGYGPSSANYVPSRTQQYHQAYYPTAAPRRVPVRLPPNPTLPAELPFRHEGTSNSNNQLPFRHEGTSNTNNQLPFRHEGTSNSNNQLPFRHEGTNNQFVTPTHEMAWENIINNNSNNRDPFNNFSSAVSPNGVYYSQNYQPNSGLLNDIENYQPNSGLINDIENHLLGESPQVGPEPMRPLLAPSDVSVNYNANWTGTNNDYNSAGADQVIQYGRYTNPAPDDVYSEPLNWMTVQQSDDYELNNTLPPFLFPEHPNGGSFFNSEQ